MKLTSIKTLSSTNRNAPVDIFRGIAILMVVLFHWEHTLPFGQVGVDLFFVISGLLVGGLLTKQLQQDMPINFFRFVLQRGFKIWPSYYTFILFGNVLAIVLYAGWADSEIIPLSDLKRYLFFYKNYIGSPYHWTFDNIWSLCVEEHFYVILPLGLIIFQRFRLQLKTLFICVGSVIILGIVSKFITFYYFHKNPYFHTNDRIDALAWGFLLNLLIVYYPNLIKKLNANRLLFWVSAALFLVFILLENPDGKGAFDLLYTRIFMPIIFFAAIAGIYSYEIKGLKSIRFISYYSYNWYLWHLMAVKLISHYFATGYVGLLLYLPASFAAAMFFTIFVEEPFLALRGRLFRKRTNRPFQYQSTAN